jgi:hypothetical protein
MRISLVMMTITAALVGSTTVAAQARQFDIHGNYSRGTATHTNAWGIGPNLQYTWGGSQAPLKLGTSLGLDYLKQEQSGPSQWNLSTDITVQPGGNGSLTPYVGGSAGSNWSTGSASQWNGARLGLEAIGGFQVKIPGLSNISWKAEERFGYVRGQEHTLATRIGVASSF